MQTDSLIERGKQRILVDMEKQVQFQPVIVGQQRQDVAQVGDPAAAFGVHAVDQNPDAVAAKLRDHRSTAVAWGTEWACLIFFML